MSGAEEWLVTNITVIGEAKDIEAFRLKYFNEPDYALFEAIIPSPPSKDLADTPVPLVYKLVWWAAGKDLERPKLRGPEHDGPNDIRTAQMLLQAPHIPSGGAALPPGQLPGHRGGGA
jgi:hypothetical protein